METPHLKMVCYQFDAYQLDVSSLELRHNGIPVALSTQSILLLGHLIQNRNRRIPCKELFDTFWPNIAVTDHCLTQAIWKLREALGDSRSCRVVFSKMDVALHMLHPDIRRRCCLCIAVCADAPKCGTRMSIT